MDKQIPNRSQTPRSPTPGSHETIERRQCNPSSSETSSGKPVQKISRPVVELLHSTCLRVLQAIVIKYPAYKGSFQGTADRLALWGTGLFRGPVSIDQALNTESKGVALLKLNISGTLSDIAVVLVHTLSLLGEPDNSDSTLQLRKLLALPELAHLPLGSLPLDDLEDVIGTPDKLKYWSSELADLTDCLFNTLSTIEMIMMATLARQDGNPAVDERVLVKSESEDFSPSEKATLAAPDRRPKWKRLFDKVASRD